jgi:hypothetical protein
VWLKQALILVSGIFFLQIIIHPFYRNKRFETDGVCLVIGNRRDKPVYLAIWRKSDWQSDLHLTASHGKSQSACASTQAQTGSRVRRKRGKLSQVDLDSRRLIDTMVRAET